MATNTNRSYTGLVRTPSSMAWLIRHRAVVQGKLDRRLLLQKRLPEEIKALKKQLQSLDHVIPLHEVHVDPKAILGRRPRKKNLVPYGSMQAGIVTYLKSNRGRWVSTAAIAAYLVEPLQIDLTVHTMSRVAVVSRDALKRLRTMGWIKSKPSEANPQRNVWSWALEDDGS